MKIRHSLFSRRQFLNGLLGGGLGVLGTSLLYPILRFVFPPSREPDQIVLPADDYLDMEPNSVRGFPWGNKPGLLKRNDDGSLIAFVAVCTHLDCNVVYQPERRRFFCACHDGWYDEEGKNTAGPPPSPLRRLFITIDGTDLIISRTEEVMET